MSKEEKKRTSTVVSAVGGELDHKKLLRASMYFESFLNEVQIKVNDGKTQFALLH